MVALLFLPCYFGLVARATGIAAQPTITPIPTPVVDFATCLAAEPGTSKRYYPGPTGQFCAAETNGGFFLVMAAADGRRAAISWSKWLHFRGWSTSGRFGLFERHDQYGNRLARVFDTTAWAETALSSEDQYCFGSMSGTCQRGVAALAPETERALLADGRLLTLANRAGRQILDTEGQLFISQAAWSPDEHHLAFLAAEMPGGPADWSKMTVSLYLANGDGSEARRVDVTARLTEMTTLEWAAESDGWLVRSEAAGYRVDPQTGRIDTIPTQ